MTRTFVDTNVFVYARDLTEPDKQERAQRWLEHLWRTRSGRTGHQVLNEYYVTVTRKLTPGLSTKAARADVIDLLTWQPVPLDAELTAAAFDIEDSMSVSYWDALVIAAAQHCECQVLLTEDLNDGESIGSITIVNPFTTPPPDHPGA